MLFGFPTRIQTSPKVLLCHKVKKDNIRLSDIVNRMIDMKNIKKMRDNIAPRQKKTSSYQQIFTPSFSPSHFIRASKSVIVLRSYISIIMATSFDFNKYSTKTEIIICESWLKFNNNFTRFRLNLISFWDFRLEMFL